MRRAVLVVLAGLSLLAPSPVHSQAIFEGGSMDAMSAGLGAGLAASIGKGALVGRTYQSAVNAQTSAAQALQLQTQAIQQYMKIGCQYEAKKNWQYAEKSFRYVLQVSALRDGPGSPTMVPTLQHLVKVSSAQGNLYDAINFQERIVGFAKNQKVPDPASVIGAQLSLANLYLKKEDYHSAEPVIRESYERAQNNDKVPSAKRIIVARTYGQILRKLNKNAEADKLEQELASGAPASSDKDAKAAVSTSLFTPVSLTAPIQAPSSVPTSPSTLPSKSSLESISMTASAPLAPGAAPPSPHVAPNDSGTATSASIERVQSGQTSTEHQTTQINAP